MERQVLPSGSIYSAEKGRGALEDERDGLISLDPAFAHGLNHLAVSCRMRTAA